MRRHWLLPLISAVAAVAYWQRITFDSKTASIVLKMTPALAMAFDVARHRGSKGRTIIIALVLHAAGDGLLDLGRRYLLAGMGMFFLGHLGYIAAFYPFRYAVADLPQSRRIAIVALVVAMAALSIYIWPRLLGVMAVAAPTYTIALTAMTGVALLGHWRGPLVMIGALLFVLSDSLLGLKLFADEQTYAPLIWPAYAAGKSSSHSATFTPLLRFQ